MMLWPLDVDVVTPTPYVTSSCCRSLVSCALRSLFSCAVAEAATPLPLQCLKSHDALAGGCRYSYSLRDKLLLWVGVSSVLHYEASSVLQW
mmetsp:Transcript_12742/g.18290  ORF Transcript_12742/g.18290 Transcript_12742/m.18290 type:complete len:91 (-) Transcript_12742:97-369(-)